jgi:hypothetical protein
VENPIVGPKFRPFSMHIIVSLSKFSCTAIAVILQRLFESTRFCTFSTFSLVLHQLHSFLISDKI